MLLNCPGYNQEEQPATSTSQALTTREAETRQSKTSTLIGKVAADIFTWDKRLINRDTLRLSFLRMRPEFGLVLDEETKDYKFKITQTILHVQRMTDRKFLHYH